MARSGTVGGKSLEEQNLGCKEGASTKGPRKKQQSGAEERDSRLGGVFEVASMISSTVT